MKEKFLKLFLLLLIIIPIFLNTSNVKSKEIEIEAKKIEYTLPYPGMLPDHPLYFLKSIRDKISIFLTRNSIKKANNLLNISDKKVRMAVFLAEKGKWSHVAKITVESEEDFKRICSTLKESKEQGVSPEQELVLKLKLSNDKHRELIEDLLTSAPSGERASIERALDLNRNSKSDLEKY